MELKNDILLRALLRKPVDRTPVWIMRQAGRYLPEYLKTRAEAGSFMDLCQTPELACEVTLQPLRRFSLDAAIIFSDILTIPDVMGLKLYFVAGEGPKFERPIRSAEDIRKLPCPDVSESLGYVMDAISLTRRELDGKVPLIGFSGSPLPRRSQAACDHAFKPRGQFARRDAGRRTSDDRRPEHQCWRRRTCHSGRRNTRRLCRLHGQRYRRS